MRFTADGNVDHLTCVRLYSAGCHAFLKNKHSSFRCFFGNVLVIIFMVVANVIVANGTCARSVSVGCSDFCFVFKSLMVSNAQLIYLKCSYT